MIHIIKHGTKYPYKLTCFHCGCIFEFQDEDIRDTEIDNKIWLKTIYCPECKQDINSHMQTDWLKKEWDYR